jgi:SAM-dependent methyltransferase
MNESFHCHCGHRLFERFSVHEAGYYDRCNQCHSLRYGPFPSQVEINEFYDNYAAYKSGLTEYLSGDDYDIFISTKKLTMLDLETPLSFFEGKRYLDIGCGTGHWLRYLAKNGLTNGFGIDASAECVAIGQQLGVEIRQTDFLDMHI